MDSPVSGASHERDFAGELRAYDQKLIDLLNERQYAIWKPWTWALADSSRYDAELLKVLQRLYGLTDELLRMHCVADAEGDAASRRRLSKEEQQRVLDLLNDEPANLRLDAGLELFDALDRVAIELGDDRYICAEVQGELYLSKHKTTWVKWRDLFGDQKPEALATYNRGSAADLDELNAARCMLASLRRVRSDDYQVHRARQRMRAKNLHILSVMLIPVVVAFGWLIAVASDLPASQVGLVAVSGALGATTAGTFKARDRLVRGSDLRAFQSGIMAQLLIGAGSALVLLVALESGVVMFGEVEAWAGQAVVGFVAGFSEPFLLRTVERIAKLGVDDDKSSQAHLRASR